MALVKCSECGGSCSTSAESCVHCGYRPPRNTKCYYCGWFDVEMGCSKFSSVSGDDKPCVAYYEEDNDY